MVADHQGGRDQGAMNACPRRFRSLWLVRIVLFVLLGLVMTDGATGRRADKSMMTGDMAGNTANCSAFETALGLSGSASQCDGKRQRGAAYESLHRSNSVVLDSKRGVRIRS
jgi:hypothetical protein